MQFITTGNRIAVENFEIGYFYTITMLSGNYFQACCTGIGSDFVMFSRDEPDLLFSLTIQSAADVSSIELYGGGSGTNDYNDLSNKPQINSITLIGNKSLSDLGIQETISDLDTIRSGAADGATAVQPADLATALATKQDTISDLNTIRSGAAAGATAVQPADLATALATKQDTLSSAQLAAVNSGIDSTKVAQIETNKNNISTITPALKECVDNGAKNKFNYDAWKDCGVFQGTKTINGNSFTIVANGDDCFTWYENGTPRPYPIDARIPCNAGDKVIFTWDYTPLSGQTNDRVGIFANGLSSTGFFAMTLASNKKIEFTAPTGTTYLSIRFGVQSTGNSATYGNIQIQSKASYDAGFTDYQPYALSNAELTAAIQALQAQLSNQ